MKKRIKGKPNVNTNGEKECKKIPQRKPKRKGKAFTNKSLDALWSKAIRRRDKKCQVCHATEHLQAHHIFSRNNYGLRWDLENGITLCAKCHLFGNASAHKSPLLFAEFLRELKGDKWYYEMITKAKKTRGVKDVDKEAVYLLLKE